MYAQDSGRRLSEWQAIGGSSDANRDGAQSLKSKNALGGSSWSFGGLPDKTTTHHGQFSPARHQEILRQSPQNYVLRQEYSTPQQETMRGQHGTPITVSSGVSWPGEQCQPPRTPQKRARSPSLMYNGSIKRRQTYNSPGMMDPSMPMPQIAKQNFFENDQQGYGNKYVTKEQVYQQEAARRLSHSPSEQPRPGRSYHNRSIQSRLGDPQQYISPHREQPRVVPASYRQSQEDQIRGISLQQAPFHPHSSPPILHQLPQQWSAPQPLQHVIPYEQDRERHRAQSQYRQIDPHNMGEQGDFRRAVTTAPENYRHQNEDDSRNFAACPPSAHFEVEKPRPKLGSPLWRNAATQSNTPKRAKVLVYGHFVERAGKRPVPEDEIDTGVSDIPFTPPQQRAKSSSVSSHHPSIRRARSKSVAPSTRIPESQQYRRKKTPNHPPSVEDVPDEDTPESTSLNEILRKQQRQGYMSRNNFDETSYRAASVLPQGSIFSHDRPRGKPPISQFAASKIFPASPPEIISLLSTPDTSVESPPRPAVRSVPMKERITPSRKPSMKKSTTTLKSTNPPTKLTPKIQKNQSARADEEESLDPTIINQKRATDLIINKEIKGKDEVLNLVLYGEVIGQTEEENQRKEDEMRAESQRKRLAKEAELQAREEAEKLAELEKLRVQAEKEENERLQKEWEEDRNGARREAERKRREALEERERDELRRKAAENIEADRKNTVEEAEERERLKQEAKERAEKVQTEAEQIAKLKAKQQETKKQVVSLNSAKLPMPDRGPGRNPDKDGDVVMEDEYTLFLSKNPPEPVRADDRSRAKSVGPSSAAEIFAHSGPKAGIRAYRTEKEEAELRRAKLAKESRLNEHWKRQEVANAIKQALSRPELVSERPKASKAPKKEFPPLKSRVTPVVSPPSSDSGCTGGRSAWQPLQPVNNIISANSSFSSTKSAPAALPPKLPQEYKSKVKLISQLERKTLEREQHAKRARENALRKAARTEQQKAERKKKDDEKARVKKKQQLIDEANENEVVLSEEDLDAQIEVFMAERETKRQRRAENLARKERILDFAPDNLALESLIRPQSQTFPKAQESNVDDEELSLEEQVKRANEAAMKESIRALALKRGGAFAQAAAKKTVADLQSDSESEEDPDEEPLPVNSKKSSSGDGDGYSVVSGSDTDDDEPNAIKGLNPDEHDAQIFPPLPDMSASFERRNKSKRQQPEISSSVRDIIENPGGSKHQVLMLYTVKTELNFNGKNGKDIILSQFLSRKEANDFAAAKVQEFRQRPTKSISEGIGEDDLYRAAVIYDRGDKNQAYIYVTECAVSSGEVADFDPSQLDSRLPEKTFFVFQYISQRRVDEETGEVQIHHNEPEILSHFSRLEMANHDACTRLITLLKPKTPRIDYVEQHENFIAKQLRETREALDHERKMFDVNIGPDEEQLQWITFSNVRMAVQLFEMNGPRN